MTNATATQLGPGVYQVTVTDICGNTNVAFVEVECFFGINDVVGTVYSVDCKHADLGAIELTLNPDIQQPIFQWSNGANSKDLHNLSAGEYTVTITDEVTHCYTVRTFTVAKSGNINSTIMGDVGCQGINGGQLSVVIDGGGGFQPVSYSWTDFSNQFFANTPLIQNLSPAVYFVTITDSEGCTGTNTYFLNYGVKLFTTQVLIAPQPMCQGQFATASASPVPYNGNSGTPPYSYEWFSCYPCDQSIGTGNQVAGLTGGKYLVKITDSNGCMSGKQFTVQESDLNLNAQVHHPCVKNDGSVHLNVTGGMAPYQYIWSNGSTTSHVDDLSNGQISVTVTDAIGCVKSQNFNMQKKTMLSSIYIQITPCYGQSNGKLAVTVDRGYPPYTYKWNNGATTSVINNLPIGTYSATVTDANGCSIVSSKVLNAKQEIKLKYIKNPTTLNTNDGKIEIEVINFNGSIQYSWSNGGNSNIISGLAPANYCVTVTGASCTVSRCFNLIPCSFGGWPPNMILSINDDDRINPSSKTNADGALKVSVSGGSGVYFFDWSGPNGFTASTSSINNLIEGKYCVTVTDGCVGAKTLCAWVGYCEDNTLKVTPKYKCVKLNTTVNITVSSNNTSGNVKYSFSPPVFIESGGSSQWYHANSSQFNNGINNITVTAIDEAGCSKSEIITIEVTVPQITSNDYWTFGGFNDLNNDEYQAKIYFQNFLQGSTQYQGLIIDPFINGCSTSFTCPPYEHGPKLGLYCANPYNFDSNGNPAPYSSCDCSEIPSEIEIFCEGTIDHAGNVPHGRANLVTSTIVNCVRYCLYANNAPYGYVFKFPVDNCNANENNTGSACTSEEDYHICVTQNLPCRLLKLCSIGSGCESSFQIEIPDGGISFSNYKFIVQSIPELQGTPNTFTSAGYFNDGLLTCQELINEFDVCLVCLQNPNEDNIAKSINDDSGKPNLTVIPNHTTGHF